MDLISPRPLTRAHDLKQELFLRAEELERLVAIYKLKLCGDEMASSNYRSKLLEQSYTDVSVDQRGQFYDIYMRKREVKLMEEWRARGAEKEAETMAMMESLARTSTMIMSNDKATVSKNDHSRQTNSGRLSSSSSETSSTSRSSATTTLNSTIRSSNSASYLRKENTKLLTGFSNDTTLRRSITRTKSSRDKMSPVKDIKARRSQSLRKNSASLGEPNDFMPLYSDPTPTMHRNLPRSDAPKPLLRKSNGTCPTEGLLTDKLRISMDSQEFINEEHHPKKTSGKQIKNEQIDLMRAEDILKLKFNKESWNSACHRFQNSSQIIESPKSRGSHVQGFLSDVHGANDFESSVDSPCFNEAIGGSHNMNQYVEGKTVRVRKKWGSVERPFLAFDASTQPIMDVTKGIKRFLKFGKRSRCIKIHDDKEDDHDSENCSFEDIRHSRMAQIPSFECFNENATLHEQVNSPHYPSHSASLNEREKLLVDNYHKGGKLS